MGSFVVRCSLLVGIFDVLLPAVLELAEGVARSVEGRTDGIFALPASVAPSGLCGSRPSAFPG